MNILHVTPYYAPAYSFGGVVRAVEGMSRALIDRGHNVTVLTTDALSQHERYSGSMDDVIDGVRVIRVRNVSLRLRRANLSTPRGFAEPAKRLLDWADITHLHEFRTVENLIVTPAAARMSQPMVMSPHGTLTLTTGRSAAKWAWDRVLSRRIARRLSAVIALTDSERQDVQTAWASLDLEPAPIFVIPNGVSIAEYSGASSELFRSAYGLGDSTICLFMGRLHARKGVDVLIRAFQAADVPHAKLVIVGPDDGMLQTITRLADERMIITGYIDGEMRRSALAAADVFVLPAMGEGLSMSALEALAAGVPVILSPGCNLPEVETAGAGWIVEPRVEPLAEGLHKLLTNRDLRREMGANARDLIADGFTWERTGAMLESVYQKLL